MNKYTTFYIVRHGETEYNIKRIAQGHLDSALTEKGINQAKELADKFKDIEFDLVFSSDLLRAKRTAEIVLLQRKLTIQTTAAIRERFYGKYEGKPFESIHTYRKLLKKLNQEQPEAQSKDEIEDNESLISRFITFLRETAVTYPDKTILVVTHGGVMRSLISHLGYKTDYGAVDNLGFMKLESDGVNFFVKEMQGIKLIS